MKKIAILGLVAVVIVLAIVGYYVANQPLSPEERDAMMEKDGDAMMEEGVMMEEDAMMEKDGAMMDDGGA